MSEKKPFEEESVGGWSDEDESEEPTPRPSSH